MGGAPPPAPPGTGHGRAAPPPAPAARPPAAGAGGDVLVRRGPATAVVDLAGRRAIPGLNDSHLHLIRGGLNFNLELRWDGVPSVADALRMLTEQARRTPPRAWARGGG